MRSVKHFNCELVSAISAPIDQRQHAGASVRADDRADVGRADIRVWKFPEHGLPELLTYPGFALTEEAE